MDFLTIVRLKIKAVLSSTGLELELSLAITLYTYRQKLPPNHDVLLVWRTLLVSVSETGGKENS